ncbi:hypothetical protein [Albirhodobacter sp. R86504]|uniref:hypothetical protein n=1 Tax=Albirhodobacter sp. R86504 TaxID=3093848 RepID=UPI0036726011
MIAAGLGAIGLVSVVVGKDDLDGPAHGILYLSARIMAALVICLGGLAVASVWMRVSQYGWTPERVSAAAMSAIVVSYGGAYLLALLRGAAWRRGIRAGNVAVALGVIGLGVMWLNPWLTPERVAVVSQLARLDPASDVERLPLWEMAHEWGRAGESALEALRKDASPALADRLAVLDRSGSRYAFDQSGFDTPEGRKALLNIVPVLPEGRSLDDATLESLLGAVGRQASALRNFEAVCARQTKAGHPQCLIVLADVDGRAEGEEMLILSADATPMVLARAVDGAGERRQSFWEQPSGMSVSDMIDAFWRDGVRLVPAQTYNFELDGALLRPRS